MAGLIREDDIALVRERADLVEIVRQHVTLKSAGGGAFKGLCPFHDEKSPSFHVRPGKGFHCFGCGEGGDVISFLMKHDGMAFNQAVEYLADKSGVQLRYTEGDHSSGPRRDRNPRSRLVEANKLAQEFYADHLAGAAGMPGRQFLDERGFDKEAAERFGLGFAPRDGDALYKHLRQKQFTDAELVAAGLVAEGQRGHYDRFRGPAALADPRDVGGDDRVRGAAPLRRRPDRGEVPQHPRDVAVQEEPRPLRHRPGTSGDRPVVPGRGRGGLHRRHGLPPLRRAHRRRDVRHGLR